MDDLFVIEKKLAEKILSTLNTIEVRGEDNLDKMLGIILTFKQAMNPPKPEENTEAIAVQSEEEE